MPQYIWGAIPRAFPPLGIWLPISNDHAVEKNGDKILRFYALEDAIHILGR